MEDQEWTEERAQAAFRKLAEAVRVFREEGGSGKPLGSMTAWSIVIHEHDFFEDKSYVSEYHEKGQAPAMTMAMLLMVYERYKNSSSMQGVIAEIVQGLTGQ